MSRPSNTSYTYPYKTQIVFLYNYNMKFDIFMIFHRAFYCQFLWDKYSFTNWYLFSNFLHVSFVFAQAKPISSTSKVSSEFLELHFLNKGITYQLLSIVFSFWTCAPTNSSDQSIIFLWQQGHLSGRQVTAESLNFDQW